MPSFIQGTFILETVCAFEKYSDHSRQTSLSISNSTHTNVSKLYGSVANSVLA
jgi:hypothetical protein